MTTPPLPVTPVDDDDDDDDAAVLSSPGGVMFNRKGDPNPSPSSSSSSPNPDPSPPLFASVRGVRVVTALGAGLKTVVLLLPFSLDVEGE